MDWMTLIMALVEVFSECDFSTPADVRRLKEERPGAFNVGLVRAIGKVEPRARLFDRMRMAREARQIIEEASDEDLACFCGMCSEYRGQGR